MIFLKATEGEKRIQEGSQAEKIGKRGEKFLKESRRTRAQNLQSLGPGQGTKARRTRRRIRRRIRNRNPKKKNTQKRNATVVIVDRTAHLTQGSHAKTESVPKKKTVLVRFQNKVVPGNEKIFSS